MRLGKMFNEHSLLDTSSNVLCCFKHIFFSSLIGSQIEYHKGKWYI